MLSQANRLAQKLVSSLPWSNAGITRVSDQRHGSDSMASLLQDLRYALRSMMKNPGFTAVATITLALGIGANTAIFSTVNAVILRPLPFEDPDRLVRAYSDRHGELWTSSPPDFVDYRRENHVFHDLAAFYSDDAALGGDEGATLHTAGVVSSSLFPILGVQPVLGAFLFQQDAV